MLAAPAGLSTRWRSQSVGATSFGSRLLQSVGTMPHEQDDVRAEQLVEHLPGSNRSVSLRAVGAGLSGRATAISPTCGETRAIADVAGGRVGS
jgi:hypothetical protein